MVCASGQKVLLLVKSGKLNQYLAGCVASMCFFGGAAAYVWVNPVLNLLISPESPVPMTSSQASWVATLPEVGTIFTAIPSGYLADIFGRKPVMIVVAPLQILAWLVIYFTSDIVVLCSMRLLQGLLLGVTSTVLPLYLGEIAQADIRGALSNLFVLSFNLGQLYEYIVGPFVSYNTLIWLSALPFLLFLVAFIWFDESPYYLLMKGEDKKAEAALKCFRNRGEDTDRELAMMKKSIEEERERKSDWKDIVKSRQGRKGLMIITVISITTFMSGFNAIVSYSSQTFLATTGAKLSSDLFTIAMGVILSGATLGISVLLDRVGRRFTLFWSHVGCAVCLLPTAVYYYLKDRTDVDVSGWWVVPVVGIVLSPTMICGSISAVRVYQSELFSTSTRGIASGLATVFLGVASSVTLRMYEALYEVNLMYLNFAVFAGFCAFGAVYIWFSAPETKGKTFDEIQKLL